MRLTLRTLLAYLDDILDPADKEELTKKVESSEFAAELIHRTRDTTRRLRLSAPQVMGTGMGLDPNTVAEYLDNVLPPDSVGDFERICLESDMHLAEVASCHHVLTMVLGEPADVDPTARHRMYAIPAELTGHKHVRVEQAHVPVAEAQPAAAVQPIPVEMHAAPRITQSALVNQSVLMEIPDYLRASTWSRYRATIIGLAALLLVAAVILFVPGVRGLFGGNSQQNSVVKGERAKSDSGVDNSMTPPSSDDTGANVRGASSQPFAGTTGPSAGAAQTQSTGIVPPPLPQMPIVDTTTQTIPEVAATPGTGIIANVPDMRAADQGMQRVGTEAMPSTTGATMPVWPTTTSSDSGLAASGAGSGSTPGMAPGMAVGSSTPAMPIPPAGDNMGKTGLPVDLTSSNAGPGPISPIPAVNVGMFLGGKTVLLRYSDKQQAWFRVEPRAAILIGDRLLALPEFRPRIALANGVGLDLSGGTLVTLKTADLVAADGLPAGDPHTPSLEIIYGRVVLINTGANEQRLRLTSGGSTADVRLAKNATLGVQVTRSYVPGVDPRKMTSPVLSEFIAPAGGITWLDANGERPIADAVRWTIADGLVSPPSALLKPVEWIDHEPAAKGSEQLAVPAIELALTIDRPAEQQLLDSYDDAKRREVKSLAARCSMHVGMFVPFVRALRDTDQRTNWRSHIDTLRVAMALNPESADKVWQTLVSERGPRAATDLFEMLCGFSLDQVGHTPEQRKNPSGPLSRLIGSLSSDSLDYRVLAVENLWEITGKRLMPNPAGSLNERALGIKDWTKRLAADELIPPAAAQ